jgi:hypothetical protein
MFWVKNSGKEPNQNAKTKGHIIYNMDYYWHLFPHFPPIPNRRIFVWLWCLHKRFLPHLHLWLDPRNCATIEIRSSCTPFSFFGIFPKKRSLAISASQLANSMEEEGMERNTCAPLLNKHLIGGLRHTPKKRMKRFRRIFLLWFKEKKQWIWSIHCFSSSEEYLLKAF